MNGVLGHDSELVRLYRAGTNWANEMNFVMNQVSCAISVAQLFDINQAHYHCIIDGNLSIIHNIAARVLVLSSFSAGSPD